MKYLILALGVLVGFSASASVTGDISRMQVTNTTSATYRVFGQVENFCTGTMISPRLVLTAGHCVYDLDSKSWMPVKTFTPARNLQSDPLGSVAVKSIYVNPAFLQGDMTQDIAVLVLEEPIGLKTGWLSIAWDLEGFKPHTSPLGGFTGAGAITGYPGDKESGSMWLVACSFYVPVGVNQVAQYNCDTFGGMSGSALIVGNSKGQSVIVGVHTQGHGTFNTGVMLSGRNKAYLQSVLQLFPM